MRAPLKFELDRRQGVLNIGYGAGSSPTFTNLTVTGVALFADGTAAAPSISFAAQTGTGFFRNSSNVELSINGTSSLRFAASGQILGVTGGAILGLYTAGQIALTAAGTNQNITLTPSTTGFVDVSGTGGLRVTTPNSSLWLYNDGGTQAVGLRLVNATLRVDGGNIYPTGGIQLYTAANSGLQIAGNGRVLLGTTTDSANGILQLATHTTSAGGIGFGTDISLYRRTSATLALAPSGGTGEVYLEFFSAATRAGYIQTNGTTDLIMNGSNVLRFYSGGTQALNFDSSQGATFSAAAAAGFCAKFNQVGGNNPTVVLQESGVSKAQWGSFSGDVYFDSLTAGKSLVLRSGAQVTALTLDASQNATFAGVASVLGLNMTSGDNTKGFLQGIEIADASAPAANAGRLYFRDNGGGKTQLVVRFNTGAVQVVATEP